MSWFHDLCYDIFLKIPEILALPLFKSFFDGSDPLRKKD